ncbi:MAG: glutathione synthase [Burkholderiales bacterium]|nr:glutathione synthase [Burkholderiales bacterium]
MANILFICDPLSSFKLQGDTTYLLMITAAQLGHEVFYTLPHEVYAEVQNTYAITHKIKLLATPNDKPGAIMPWYREEPLATTQKLTEFKAILVRNDPPFNMEYFYLTQLLTLAEQEGATVINSSFSLRNFNEKLSILNFPHLVPPTIVTKHKQILKDFLNLYQECVIKPLDLMAGRGVFKLSPTDVNCNAILENSTNYYTETVMLQKFIPEVVNGDRRIFIINGIVCDYCLHRIPPKNEIRGNLAAGGRGEAHKLTTADLLIAQDVALWLKQQNILFAGIDVIGNKLTEINITSPTAAQTIFQQTGINLTQLIIEAITK